MAVRKRGPAAQATLLVLADAGGVVRVAEGLALARFGLSGRGIVGRPFAEAWAAWPAVVDGFRRAVEGRASLEEVAAGNEVFRLKFEPRSDEEGGDAGVTVQGHPSVYRPSPDRRDLTMLLSQVPGAIWTTDRQLKVRRALGNLRGWRELDEARVLGTPVGEILQVGAGDPIVAAHRRALDGERTSLRYRFHERMYRTTIEPLRTPEGAVEGAIGLAVDVTDSWSMEQELARNQAWLGEAQRVAHVGVWDWDVAGDKVHWSDELCHVYGLEKPPAGYEEFLAHVVPEDREHTTRMVMEALRSGTSYAYEHRIQRPDGSIRMLHTRGAAIVEDGKVVRLSGACWDVTDLWDSRRRLERSISLLTATLESTADGLLVVDPEKHISAFNQRLLDLWGVSREAVEHMSFDQLLDMVHDQLEDADACLRTVREMNEHPRAESFDSLNFRDGRFFERYSRPQRIGEAIVGRVWSYRDVTQRERLLRNAVFLADASRLLASLEIKTALEATGHLALRSLGDAIAVDLFKGGEPRRLLMLSRDPRFPIGELPRTAREGQPAIYQVGTTSYLTVPLRSRGEVLGALSLAGPRERHFGETDVTLATELAGRIELAVENARLYQEARDALKVRDDFLAVAAHEIRGPVASLHLAVQGLLRDPGGSNGPKMLAIIEREDRRIARFVDELLDVARLRSGQLQYVFGEVDFASVVREVTTRLQTELSRSGSALTLTAPQTLVGTWDRARLDQVVTNLVTNAIKFGLGKPIEVALSRQGALARLEVRDQGIGIAPEAHERIFAPFERAVSTSHYGGLGLGLFIARSVVHTFGGTLTLVSSPGAGTTFTVELPVTKHGGTGG